MSEKPEVITSEVEASDQTVEAVRKEIPVGVTGAPIDRLPLNLQLQQLASSGIYVKRFASTDRCIRVVDVPLKGGATGQFHCSRACVRIGDMQLCPEHDKTAFAPQQSPVAKGRTINSASIPLSAGEQEELRKTSKSFASPPPAREPVSVAPTAPVPLSAEQPGVITLRIGITELAGGDLLDVLKARICEALDNLACGTVREMKQIVALQERVAKLSKGRKRNAE